MGCHIISPLKELCPQSLRRSIRQRTSLRVPTYLDNQNTVLLQTLDFGVHDLDRFFNEVEFFVDLDFIQRYSKSLVSQSLLQVRDVKRTVNSTQLLWEFKSIGDGSYFS
ncbi:hypothetical protein Tco_0382197 [Tanacetum coccineum]